MNGEWSIEIFNELGILIGNKCFKKRMIHKYTWERVAHGGAADNSDGICDNFERSEWGGYWMRMF